VDRHEETDDQRAKRVARASRHFGRLLLLGGLVAGLAFTAPRAWRGYAEDSPTHIDIDRWPQDYRGQYWLEVTGYLRPDLAANTGPAGEHQKSDTRYAYVPIVSATYKRGDRIYAVVCLGPMKDSAKDEVAERGWSGRVTISGLASARNSARLFPGLNVDDSAVYINEGQTPDPKVEMCFAMFCLAGILFWLVLYVRIWRNWARKKSGVVDGG